MENQTTNDSTPINKIICRKCNGPHFTIKCGKDKKEENTEVTTLENKSDSKYNNKSDSKYNNKSDSKYNNNDFSDINKSKGARKPYFKTTYRVKISELPNNITEEEMMELTAEWGHIVRLKVLNYNESSTSYVDFGYEDEANYFIQAIDKTPFDLLIISAIRVDSYRHEKSDEQKQN